MVNNIDDSFLDGINPSADSADSENNVENNRDNFESSTTANKKAQEQAQKNLLARKRIDELKEKKRLRELLDNSEDW